MSVLIILIISLFGLKIIWNFSVPYRLLTKMRNYVSGQPKPGISLSLEVEVILLFVAIALSWLSSGDSILNRPIQILEFGGFAIIASYLHFFIAGKIADFILSKKRPI